MAQQEVTNSYKIVLVNLYKTKYKFSEVIPTGRSI